MYNAKAYSARSAASGLASTTVERREANEHDVQIEILFCGICHSDLHQARNEWKSVMPTVYPCVPGHEIVGRVTKVGAAVTKFKPGDLAAVGCLVDSDGTCPECQAGLEQFCTNADPHLQLRRQAHRAASPTAATPTASWSMSGSCCASRRTWTWPEPRRCSAPGSPPIRPCATGASRKGKKVGIVGLGGLGHMGVKFAHALGAHMVVFTTSPGKKDDALRLGADEVVVSRNADEMQKHAGSFDFILDAVSADHDINAYINLLRRDGNITLVGAPEQAAARRGFGLLMRRRSLSGLPHRRHRRNAGDARLLRHAQHHRRTSKSSRSRRSTRPTSGCLSPT